MAAAALFASCNKNTDIDTTEILPPGGPQVEITLRSEGQTRAFFDETAAAEPWESEIHALSVHVFDQSGTLIIKRTLTTGEIAARSVRISLPNSAAGTTCSFYVSTGSDYGTMGTRDEIVQKKIQTVGADNSRDFSEVAQNHGNGQGFIMSGFATATIAVAGSATTVGVTVRRLVAKIAVRAKVAEAFQASLHTGTITIDNATVSQGNSASYVFHNPAGTYTDPFTFTHTQQTDRSGAYTQALFYVNETPPVPTDAQKLILTLTGYYDADGNSSSTNDRSTLEYRIVLDGSGGGEIKRNGYYRVDATIHGFSGDGASVNITAADWEGPFTQAVNLGQ